MSKISNLLAPIDQLTFVTGTDAGANTASAGRYDGVTLKMLADLIGWTTGFHPVLRPTPGLPKGTVRIAERRTDDDVAIITVAAKLDEYTFDRALGAVAECAITSGAMTHDDINAVLARYGWSLKIRRDGDPDKAGRTLTFKLTAHRKAVTTAFADRQSARKAFASRMVYAGGRMGVKVYVDSDPDPSAPKEFNVESKVKSLVKAADAAPNGDGLDLIDALVKALSNHVTLGRAAQAAREAEASEAVNDHSDAVPETA